MCGEKQCYRLKESKCDKNETPKIQDTEAFRNACELIRKYIPKHGIYLAEFEHVLTGISLEQIEKMEKRK